MAKKKRKRGPIKLELLDVQKQCEPYFTMFTSLEPQIGKTVIWKLDKFRWWLRITWAKP
jgi:hypothetical protein